MKNKHFWELVKNLKKYGYISRVKKVKIGKFRGLVAVHKKKSTGITLGFGTNNSFGCLSGTICADNIKCFDRWAKCPLHLKIPENKKQFNFLLERIKFLATDKGFIWSNTYTYLDDPIIQYPEN